VRQLAAFHRLQNLLPRARLSASYGHLISFGFTTMLV